MKTMIAEIDGMIFEHSMVGLRRQLQGRQGIESVEVDAPSDIAIIRYDESRLTADFVKRSIDECGYHFRGEIPANLRSRGKDRTQNPA